MKIDFYQGFGENANPYYREHGLKGHTGIDCGGGYGSPIHADYDFTVYKTFTKERPGTDGFTGIFAIYDDGIQCFEWCVGHCSEVYVSEGQKVKAGELIGAEGNFGIVFSGNRRITFKDAIAGDHAGTHRHYQYRAIRPVNRTYKNRVYLATTSGIFYDGKYYEVWDYNNGFNGCIDYTLPIFGRNLTQEVSGYDVFVLQRILAREQCFNYETTGYFGKITHAALVKYQKKHGIEPTFGFCGPITREHIKSYIVGPRSEAVGS